MQSDGKYMKMDIFVDGNELIKMDICIAQGRPADCSGRIVNEARSYDFLDRIGVAYMRADHPVAFDMDTCNSVGDALGTHICKNLFLCNRQETSFFLLMMPGDKKFKTKDISAQINSSRLSFANEYHMKDLLGLTPGSVTVLGLMNDAAGRVRLVIDRDLLEGYSTIGVHPCTNTSTVKLSVADLMETVIPALRHEPTIVDLPWYRDEE